MRCRILAEVRSVHECWVDVDDPKSLTEQDWYDIYGVNGQERCVDYAVETELFRVEDKDGNMVRDLEVEQMILG